MAANFITLHYHCQGRFSFALTLQRYNTNLYNCKFFIKFPKNLDNYQIYILIIDKFAKTYTSNG